MRRVLLYPLFLFLVQIPILHAGSLCSEVTGAEIIPGEVRSSCSPDLAEKIGYLDLYIINEGELHRRTIEGRDLRKGAVSVEGYVCGIAVFCGREITAKVDGKKMVGGIPITEAKAGSLRKKEDTNPETGKKKNRGEGFPAPEGYSCFPLVKGDAVSSNNEFRISLEMGNEVLEVPVRQQSYRAIRATQDQKESRNEISFQYLGSRPGLFESEKMQSRLRAVAQGIDAVHRTFDTRIVQKVKIIDYEGIHNAFICEDESDIWFYSQTLRNEPLEELRIMAEHEAIHLLVERRKFTKSSELRKVYSDLKGYDEFSYKRFLLMTKGVPPVNPKATKGEKSLFFSFVDERNFIAGMKGGHSHENPAEFCTSFLHSIMYLDRLMSNLEKPLDMEGDRGERRLSPTEKIHVLKTYLQVSEILMKVDTSTLVAADPCVNPDGIMALLEKGVSEIQKELHS